MKTGVIEEVIAGIESWVLLLGAYGDMEKKKWQYLNKMVATMLTPTLWS